MIERLRIQQLALVDELELEFGPGLNVLTGETGAGKSIVLGALGLLAGARADRDSIREGADEAVVEAVFEIAGLTDLEASLAERGLEAEEGALIVRRSLQRSGRGRAWVGGQLVPIQTLAELFGGRLEVSSQHASQALLRPDLQGRLLDHHGGLWADRAAIEAGVRGLRERHAELVALRTEAEERARREDFLAFQVREIDDAGLDVEEAAQIDVEHRRLVHSERLGGEASSVVAALSGDPSGGAEASIGDRLAEAERSLATLAELDPSLTDAAERMAGATAELADLARDLERYAAQVETDPGRLSAVEDRIQELERLRRKYGSRVEEILAFRDSAAAELRTLGSSDERMGKLEAEQAAEHQEVAKRAAKLSRARRKAATALAEAAQASVRVLAMASAQVEVALSPVEPEPGLPCGPSGAESAEILFSSNEGETPRPLRKVASGGELSRIFLALKNVLRAQTAGMVLVFDEVDAGIGGAVAERVGGVLGSLAVDHQVLCITHLPQIAAQPAHHFRVEKRQAGGRTLTRVVALDPESRVDEIARMAGGEAPGAETHEHARALLERARTGAASGKARVRKRS
ncbi:MAG: DNA repair protein RecN [bacterium]|nr:DNA repair protein RecN [bacterium]MCP5069559.1 DNA repair protein RecN [bacterium]